jgi:hypothetical protein
MVITDSNFGKTRINYSFQDLKESKRVSHKLLDLVWQAGTIEIRLIF